MSKKKSKKIKCTRCTSCVCPKCIALAEKNTDAALGRIAYLRALEKRCDNWKSAAILMTMITCLFAVVFYAKYGW